MTIAGRRREMGLGSLAGVSLKGNEPRRVSRRLQRRKPWKEETGYHRRSLAETGVARAFGVKM